MTDIPRGQGGDGSPQLDLDAIERGHMMGDLDGGKHWVEMSAGQRSALLALVRRLQQENEELRAEVDEQADVVMTIGISNTHDEILTLRGRVEELTEALRKQVEYTKIEYGGCGGLAWTVEKWGRLTHKHGCANRTDLFCQTHPEGCP